MPARINKIRHDENTRLKIKTAYIINRFQDHFAGKIELTTTQITAGKILLDRTLPVLQSVEHSGEVTTTKVIRAPALTPTIEAWEEAHVPKEFH